MKKSYVYKITCKITGEFYFGSSFRAMLDYYWGSGRRIKERISQYGKENFVKEILGEFDDRIEAHKKENQYIEKFRHDEKCLNEKLEHHFGSFCEESRAKNGSAFRGKHHTEEVKAKISAALCGEKSPWYGKQFSEEHKAKMSAAHRGKQFSEEHRAKLSAARRGKHWIKNPVTGKREYYD